MAEVHADEVGIIHFGPGASGDNLLISKSDQTCIPVQAVPESVGITHLEEFVSSDNLCAPENMEHDQDSSASQSPGKDQLTNDVSSLTIRSDQTKVAPAYQPIIYVRQTGGEISLATEDGILLTSDPHAPALTLEQEDFNLTTVEQRTVDELTSTEECSADVQCVTNQVAYPVVLSKDSHASLEQSLAVEDMDNNQLHNSMVVLKTTTGETFQVITLQELSQLAKGGQVVQTLPAGGSSNLSEHIVQANGSTMHLNAEKIEDECVGPVVGYTPGLESLAGILVSSSVVANSLPPGTPHWAERLRDCEKLGDSYRGWVETEIELDLLLTMHKQHTHSLWGTRQSPSPAKPSTRLMWKSQYVPFDGIPFVNAGSRAIVLECQFGPRRKGAHSKRQATCREISKIGEFKQTCPVRIYIKKVKKFPSFAVDVGMDKKQLKFAMDKSFIALREQGVKGHGQERYYVQLPTEEAHEFHGERSTEAPHRLHPKVAEKIRDIVSSGETRLYVIRKILRKFVEKDLFNVEEIPEKHDLTYYPTVNDLQNHIHQAVRDMESGLLHVSAPTVKVEMIAGNCTNEELSADDGGFPVSWQQWSSPEGHPHTESVTVTLTQNPDEDGQHVISKVETHLSDGSTQVTTNLTPETANLLSKLHPTMFPGSSGIQQEVLLSEPSSVSHSEVTHLVSNESPDEITLTSDSHPEYILMEDESSIT